MIKDEAGPIWLELSVYSKKRVWLNTAECRAVFRVQMTFSSYLFLDHRLGPAKFSRPALAVTDSDNPLEHVPPLSTSPML